MRKKPALPYVQEFRDRQGALRRYVRIKGKRLVALPGKKGSQEFMDVYRATVKKAVRIPAKFRKPFGIIYFAECGGFIKIGFTSNHRQRMSQIQMHSPAPVKLLGSIPGGLATEAELHTRFEHLRHRGEWFRAEPDLLDYVSKLRSDEVSNNSNTK